MTDTTGQTLSERARAACDKATPGPWHVQPGVYDSNPETATEFPHGPEVTVGDGTVAYCQMYGEADAHMIAAARTLIPELAAALDAQAALVKELVEALEELYAIVRGECPSLLNEDSGGSASLDMQIAAALTKYKEAQP